MNWLQRTFTPLIKVTNMKKIFLLLTLLFIAGCTTSTGQNLDNTTKYSSENEPYLSLIEKTCTKDTSNVYTTECTIDLLDKVAAEREWKQNKIETVEHPQIDIYNMFGDLESYHKTIKDWRLNFEEMRDQWCKSKFTFTIGSGIPYATAACKLDIELRAIDDLNFIHNNILESSPNSQGIQDFEPTQEDIEKLVETNKTKRGCIWAGEEEPNCDSPIDITPLSENMKVSSTTDYCDCEKTFEKPVTTVLNGRVIATFVSGGAIGIEVSDKNDQFGQYYVEMPAGMNYNNLDYDNVKIEGKMVGVTCAYYNSVFGECVGDVIADSIKQSPAK